MPNDAVLTSTIAALLGSAIGASAPALSNYILQNGTTKRELLTRQIDSRETLYSLFIQEAARLYAHSLTHDLEDFDKLVALYALVARIRLIASQPVVDSSEHLVREIIVHYGENNLSLQEMREEVIATKTDPLSAFSKACRKELVDIFSRANTGFSQ